MNNFTFHNPTKIFFGRGQIARLADAVPHQDTVLLLYGGGSIRRNGVYEAVMAALGSRNVLEFGGIEPNPTYETLLEAVALAREEDVGFLLAVGGGSVLDGTKFVAAAAAMEEGADPWSLLTGTAPKSALPLGAVMTLPATGSEMNGFAVISRRQTREKRSFGSPLLFPRFSVLDPETTFSLPERQIANGVADAFVHTLEQYLTFPAAAPLQDRMAEAVLRTLIEVGPQTLAQPTDYDARAAFMWTATVALNGILGVGVPQDWTTHALGHELTALYGLDHARSLTVVLPGLMRVRREAKRDKLLQYAERVWDLTDGDADARLDAAIERTAAFFERLGLPTRLSAYPEVAPDTPDLVAARLQDRLPLGERRDLGADDVHRILRLSLVGG